MLKNKTKAPLSQNTIQLKVYGRVQGVGFRPFVYRLAKQYQLTGWVNNQSSHVQIFIEGKNKDIDLFIEKLQSKAPKISKINKIEKSKLKKIHHKQYNTFKIISSNASTPLSNLTSNKKINTDGTVHPQEKYSQIITEVSPDLSVCNDCLADIKTNKRQNYSFTNCTNCGPRFSIIQKLPYDRSSTTMKDFEMCSECLEEYSSHSNRRFHAQPNSCSQCGPSYTMTLSNDKETKIIDIDIILKKCSELILSGETIAIKGIGGYHLACNAFDDKAVTKLREIKKRDKKPLAVMFASAEDITQYAELSIKEENSLKSIQAPIVLLQKKDKTYLNISDNVTSHLNSIGCILPYTPFHFLLLEVLKKNNVPVIVLTSANITNNPIEIENKVVLSKFSHSCAAILTYNRDIQNRSVKIINNKERIIRRSRGYVPESILLNHDVNGVLALGAEVKNCFCIGLGNKAIFSQHIGDLKSYDTFEFYKNTIDDYKNLFQFKSSIVVHDKHPNYFSTKYAKNISQMESSVVLTEGGGSNTTSHLRYPINTIAVQHHHAHIVSCMAENNVTEPVIGFSFDGTGLGDDGHIWGGEVFTCDLENYNREFHFEYIPLVGGDKVIQEPWRMAVSVLYYFLGSKEFEFLRKQNKNNILLFKKMSFEKINMITKMIDKNINCFQTSSVGRIFDAVSALLGLCLYSDFDGEAPMRLEDILNEIHRFDTCPTIGGASIKPVKKSNEQYKFEIIDNKINLKKTFIGLIEDIQNEKTNSEISLKFHNTILETIYTSAKKIREKYNINKIALSGGVFMNKYLLENAEIKLKEMGFDVFTHSKVPCNDGGLALGQLVIASTKTPELLPSFRGAGGGILCV